MKIAVLLTVVLGLAAPARADETQMSGFVTHGGGEISGRVTDDAKAPIGGIAVHIVSDGRDRTVTTDKDGRYRAVLAANSTSYIFVNRKAHVSGLFSDGEGDVVEIHETVPPLVMPKPKFDPSLIPDYSDQASDADVWVRAWLMLDISETGTVTRLKLINPAGFELDPIAVRTAFKLSFEPARDLAKQPIRALMLWSFEWPAYWWMLGNNHRIDRVPGEASLMSCRRNGPPTSRARDCSKPDLAHATTQTWIDRPAPKRR